jgi:hypothetical protein
VSMSVSWKTSSRLSIVFSVVCAACSSTDATVAETFTTPAPSAPDDGSRPGADGSRPGAGSPTGPSPSEDAKGPFFRADGAKIAAFSLDEAAVANTNDAITIANGKGHDGTDPEPSGYHGGSFYNGGSYRYATASSPEWIASAKFDTITPSFEASTPPGTWIHVKVAARIDGTWTKDYSLGVWAEDDSTIRRHSVEGQGDASGDVSTDTLELTKPADALRITTILFSASTATPSLRAVSAIATTKSAFPTAGASGSGDATALGKNLAVPKRSQMIYPNGGEAWCSPTSTSMLLGYWADSLDASGLRETPPQAAGKCNDHVYQGTGNWPFNTAHAASIDGGRLHGAVTRLASFEQVERLIGASIPVAISVAYGKGELSRSPISSTVGHLIVVRGFAANGDVICNDPAFGSDASVEVTYDRAQLAAAWKRSLGTTYLVWPRTKQLPADPAGAF